MTKSKTSDVPASLNRIVDDMTADYGMMCPESMLLDAIAVSGREHGLTIRYCCRRSMNSSGLLAHHFLVINNRYILRCIPKTRNKRTRLRQPVKNNRATPCFSRNYSNTILECVRLADD